MKVPVTSTYSPTFDIASVLNFSYSSRGPTVSHCIFKFHFSNNLRCWTSFHVFMSLKIHIPSSVQCLSKSFVHFYQGICFMLLSCKRSLCISDINPLSDMFCIYFLTICGLSLHFLNSVFQRVLYMWWSPMTNIFFYGLWSRGLI